jgi:predicted nucleotidyltransferase
MPISFEQYREDITELCRTYGVERLEAFGSAVTEKFDDETSDLDFVVQFADRSTGYADRYLDFAQALEELFGQDVDLVTERSIQNPFFRRSVDDSRQVIYDRSGQETTA